MEQRVLCARIRPSAPWALRDQGKSKNAEALETQSQSGAERNGAGWSGAGRSGEKREGASGGASCARWGDVAGGRQGRRRDLRRDEARSASAKAKVVMGELQSGRSNTERGGQPWT